MSEVRVMHYMNQFFAGKGGEDKADVPVGSIKGAVGPGKRLQELLGDSAEIVVTTYCGDDYFPTHHDEVLESILRIAKANEVKIVVAGPTFNSGRHGFACAELCHAATATLGLDCVTAMYPENPGVETYKQYKDRKIFALPTTDNVTGMEEALKKIAQFVSKLTSGVSIGPAAEEGYIPRGIRVMETVSKTGAERVIEMLLDQHYGRPFVTEVPVESLEEIPILPPITNLAEACVALVSETGLVPLGNPDGFKSHRNTIWNKYSIAGLDSFQEGKWELRHAGWDVSFNTKNPNYAAPLDVARQTEREGMFASLYPALYSVCGNNGQISVMQRIGQEMAADMKAEGVDIALLVATWGTGTRSGATIAREIERGGVAVALITAMTMLGKQIGANRIVPGAKIAHVCGDPSLPADEDVALRRRIVERALEAVQTEVKGPTVFELDVKYTAG